MGAYRRGQSGAWNGEIGPILEEARQRRGLSLKEAERYTNIRARYLESLERENPGELPGKGYVQGFLSSYAEFLGLDVEDLGRRFKRHSGGRRQRREQRALAEGQPAVVPASAPRPGDSRSGWRSPSGALLSLSLAALALVLVVAAFYLLGRDFPTSTGTVSGEEAPTEGGPRGDGQGGPPPVVEEEGGAGQEEPAAAPASTEAVSGEGESLRLTVRVRGAESWISVESDSGVEYTGIARPGFSRSFESGRSMRLTTGNAGAVRVEINGQEYGILGESGEVTSRSFTLKRER